MIMKVGFIGAGNMASAMIGGMLQKGLLQKEDIIASSATQTTADRVAQEFGIRTTLDNKEVAKAEIVILAIKPIYCEGVIREIRDQIGENQIVVTIVAGRSLQWLSDTFGKPVKLIRTMPNTPALVGEAITALCPGELVSEEELEEVCSLFRGFGKAEVVGEHLMDAVVAVSGSSPAYVLCLSRLWQMQQWQRECRGCRHISSQHSQFLAVPKWYWKQESIRESSRIWYVLRPVQPLQEYVNWRKRDFEAA